MFDDTGGASIKFGTFNWDDERFRVLPNVFLLGTNPQAAGWLQGLSDFKRFYYIQRRIPYEPFPLLFTTSPKETLVKCLGCDHLMSEQRIVVRSFGYPPVNYQFVN